METKIGLSNRKNGIICKFMERDRRSLMVVSPYPFGEVGGVVENIRTIAEELENAKGYDVTKVGPKGKINDGADETLGLTLPMKMTKTSYRGGASANLVRAIGIVDRADTDIAWFHDPFAALSPTLILLLALQGKATTDATFHAYTSELTFFNRALKFLGNVTGVKRVILDRIDGRSAVSVPSARMWSEINGEESRVYDILPNPIDTDLFTPDGPIKNEWIKNGERIIFFAGRHDKRKGLRDLVKAFNKLVKDDPNTNLRLKLTGDGDETEFIKQQIKSLGIEHLVEFLGKISKEDLTNAYRTVAKSRGVAVAPSVDGEAFNRTIAEARASGALVVATNIEGQKSAYGDEETFGEMADPSNSEDLAYKIAMQLNLPVEEARNRSEKGVLYTRGSFSVSKVADLVVAHHTKVIRSKFGGDGAPSEGKHKKRSF